MSAVFRRILVGYDGSDSARAALELAIDLARATRAELATLSVEEHLPRYAATIGEVRGAKELIDRHFRALTKEARDQAALAGVELDTIVRRGHEVAEILRTAREERIDLLALGAHGHSRVFEWVIGSTSLAVARLAPCSVLVVRARPGGRTRLAHLGPIVVGLDGSPLGRLAFRTALDLATLAAAAIVGVTVQETSPLARPAALDRRTLERLGDAAREQADAAGVAFEHALLAGHAAQALREHARHVGAGLLVLGATGLEHPWSPTLGGTAGAVVGEAPCPVLLVRSPQAALRVAEVMTRAVVSVTTETPLAEVVERLVRADVKALPVVDARRRVVGILTGGDLLRRGDVTLRLAIQRELDPAALRERLETLRRSPKTAADVMTSPVHTVSVDADLAAAVRLMAARGVKRLPVVDRARTLVGIVSRADVLRTLAAVPGVEHHSAPLGPRTARTVAEAATRDVPVVGPDAGVEEVVTRVLESPLRRVVVVAPDGTVLGLIGDRDLLARVAPDARPWLLRVLQRGAPAGRAPGPPLTAATLMAPTLITVRPDDSLAHAIRLMMHHRVKRLVVVDASGRLRGLVDRREILRLLAG